MKWAITVKRRRIMPNILILVLSAMIVLNYERTDAPPAYTIEVRCPFTISDADTVTIKTSRGPIELGAPVIQLDHVSEPCPGHLIEIRR